ncbi:MAG: M20/M25/M40 family metallo-hydrolase [Firmicutes bacterium]|nr:M20/M25/M40 family metallo-hydrolase [Bacillota bacterium]
MYENLCSNIKDNLLNLVSIKSDTGTRLERKIEFFIHDQLSRINYYKENTELYGAYKLEKDHLERAIVWSLVKGEGKDTVILLHHHDAVDADDYRQLSKFAYDPDALSNELKKLSLSEEVRKDLEGNEWIFGRGTADMKAGAAIQLSLIEKYSKKTNFNGNILLLSVPDEENLSLGMREAVKLLNKLKKSFNLEYKLLINSEPHGRREDEIATLYEGSAGKVTPLIYVRGKQTHILDVFQGINPIALLSEVIKRSEMNLDFVDKVGKEQSPPPAWINTRDRKIAYDISIPQAAGGYLNVITLNSSPKEVINKIKNICESSFSEAIEIIREKYKKYESLVEKDIVDMKIPWKVNVKDFSEVYKQAYNKYGNVFIEDYKRAMDEVKRKIENNDINMQEGTFELIEKTLEYIDDFSPIMVIAVSPPYYPNVSNITMENLSEMVLNLNQEISKYSKEKWNISYEKQNYFMGISDMSYVSLSDSMEDVSSIGDNMPLWDNIYSIDFKGIKSLNIPVMNIGPWGKDIHKFSERVFKKDVYERVPELIEFTIKKILNQ